MSASDVDTLLGDRVRHIMMTRIRTYFLLAISITGKFTCWGRKRGKTSLCGGTVELLYILLHVFSVGDSIQSKDVKAISTAICFQPPLFPF